MRNLLLTILLLATGCMAKPLPGRSISIPRLTSSVDPTTFAPGLEKLTWKQREGPVWCVVAITLPEQASLQAQWLKNGQPLDSEKVSVPAGKHFVAFSFSGELTAGDLTCRLDLEGVGVVERTLNVTL